MGARSHRSQKGPLMRLREFAYGAYERRLVSNLPPDRPPKPVGAIVDGNRRWARGAGAGVHGGYQAGADKISEFLGWGDEGGVEGVSLWLLSRHHLHRPA